jgi:hypothetical protein
VPRGPVLFVGNHNGGIMGPDLSRGREQTCRRRGQCHPPRNAARARGKGGESGMSVPESRVRRARRRAPHRLLHIRTDLSRADPTEHRRVWPSASSRSASGNHGVRQNLPERFQNRRCWSRLGSNDRVLGHHTGPVALFAGGVVLGVRHAVLRAAQGLAKLSVTPLLPSCHQP